MSKKAFLKAFTSSHILVGYPPWDMLFLKLLLQFEAELGGRDCNIIALLSKTFSSLRFKTHSLANNSQFLLAQRKPML